MQQILFWCSHVFSLRRVGLLSSTHTASAKPEVLQLAANINAVSVMSQNSGPYACACGTDVENFIL
jgi:hypothetical protein